MSNKAQPEPTIEERRRTAIRGEILAVTPPALRSLAERLVSEGHTLESARPELLAAHRRMHPDLVQASTTRDTVSPSMSDAERVEMTRAVGMVMGGTDLGSRLAREESERLAAARLRHRSDCPPELTEDNVLAAIRGLRS